MDGWTQDSLTIKTLSWALTPDTLLPVTLSPRRNGEMAWNSFLGGMTGLGVGEWGR